MLARTSKNSSNPLTAFHFDLPKHLIAIFPSFQREDSKLLVFDRTLRNIFHTRFNKITEWVRPGDLLVLNQARVDPSRVPWQKSKDKDQEELIFLKPLDGTAKGSRWEAIVSGRKIGFRTPFLLPGGVSFYLESRKSDGIATIFVDRDIEGVRDWLEQYGLSPIPPYIREERTRRRLEENQPLDQERYQTVFAKQSGAVAAPTAGLHFSKDLLAQLEKQGVQIAPIFLGVGWGTFAPLSLEHWKTGKLHPEWVEIGEDTTSKIIKAQKENRRIIAVGSTVLRTLEWWHLLGRPERDLSGWCDLFIRPPLEPQVSQAMITNFHLPGSSLLALVAAFLGKGGDVLSIYKEAMELEYRFYSYGDSMLIL